MRKSKKAREYERMQKAGYERKSIARGSAWHWVKKKKKVKHGR